MKKTLIKIDLTKPSSFPKGKINKQHLDATTEEDILVQQRLDDDEAMRDIAKFARRVRKRLGMSQSELSRCIEVSIETIRNWEQGKRRPVGAAKALLKMIDRSPELALMSFR